MDHYKKWVLLEHRVSCDDLTLNHYDLLLEDKNFCRAWRLEEMPQVDCQPQSISISKPHNLYWLETEGRDVSGGRGWASPVLRGFYIGVLPVDFEDPVSVELHSSTFHALLEIGQKACKLTSIS